MRRLSALDLSTTTDERNQVMTEYVNAKRRSSYGPQIRKDTFIGALKRDLLLHDLATSRKKLGKI